MTFTGTPAAFASSRPSVAVVPPTSPEALSTEPSTGLPVNTATRSVPVGASWDFCAAVGAGGALAQPAATIAASAIPVLLMRTSFPVRCRIVSSQGRHRFNQEMLMKRVHAAGAVLAATLVAGGCVSKGDYEKLQADKNAEIASLKKDKTALEQQKTSLEQQQADSKKHIDALEQQKAQLQTTSQQD